MIKSKIFAACVFAGICGPNLYASELQSRWSIISAELNGQSMQTAGQKCLEDSFFEINGDVAKFTLSDSSGGSCKSGKQSYEYKSLGGGRYALIANGADAGEFWINGDELKLKQPLDGGKFIVFGFKKDAANSTGVATNQAQFNMNGAKPQSGGELEGRWDVVSVTTQGQTFKTAGQKCFEDSFFQIAGGKATVSIVAANSDGSCKTGAGSSGYQSLGSGRYALDKDAGEFRLKGDTLEYRQADNDIVFTFKKRAGGASSSGSAQARSSSSANQAANAKDPGVKHSDAKATKKGTGVFAGKWVFINTNTDISFYLRDDGTYASRLGKPDWRTRIDGTYKKDGKKIVQTANDGEQSTYSCENADCTFLWSDGGYHLFNAQILNEVPKGSYSFTAVGSMSVYNASGGTDIVGGGVSGYYDFDGKGRFRDGSWAYSSAAMSNVGGGGTRSSSSTGSYTLDSGELTLRYDDGRTQRHSFFYIPPTSEGKAGGVVVDGVIYFLDE